MKNENLEVREEYRRKQSPPRWFIIFEISGALILFAIFLVMEFFRNAFLFGRFLFRFMLGKVNLFTYILTAALGYAVAMAAVTFLFYLYDK